MEKLGPGRWRVNATVRLEDFRREHPELGRVGEVDTMGGLMLLQLETVPAVGQSDLLGEHLSEGARSPAGPLWRQVIWSPNTSLTATMNPSVAVLSLDVRRPAWWQRLLQRLRYGRHRRPVRRPRLYVVPRRRPGTG